MTAIAVRTVPTQRWSLLTRLLQHRLAVAGLAMVAVVMVIVVFGSAMAPMDPAIQDLPNRRTPPSADAWLGRDGYGRDILSRLMVGARATMVASSAAVGIGGLIGAVIGVIAGRHHGWVSKFLMRVVDLLASFPYFLLAILIVAAFGPSLRNAVIGVAVPMIPTFARLARGATLEVAGNEYIDASRSVGMSGWYVTWFHIVPNILSPLVVLVTVSLGMAVISISSLSFLGLGAQPPDPEWGSMLSEGRDLITVAPHVTVIPGLAILWTVLGLNLLGDGLRDVLDPKEVR